MTIARVLTAEMKRQKLGYNGLARLAELSPGRVHAVLSGSTPSPTFGTVMKLLSALGKDADWLRKKMG